MIALAPGLLALAVWIGLVLGRDGFWLARERDTRDLPPEPVEWPEVVAVVPARDEVEVIARSARLWQRNRAISETMTSPCASARATRLRNVSGACAISASVSHK